MDKLTQMERTIQWIERNQHKAPTWAKFMYCSRSNEHYGHFAERKPQFDQRTGDFYNTGGKNEHFRADNPGWGIRYNISPGNIRIMETAETMNILDQVQEPESDKPVCGYCKQLLTDSNCAPYPVNTAFGHRTFTVDYDVKHFPCGRTTTIRVRVLSPFDIKDAEYRNV